MVLMAERNRLLSRRILPCLIRRLHDHCAAPYREHQEGEGAEQRQAQNRIGSRVKRSRHRSDIQ